MKKILIITIMVAIITFSGYRLFSKQRENILFVSLHKQIDLLLQDILHLKKDIQVLPKIETDQNNTNQIDESIGVEKIQTDRDAINRQNIFNAINNERAKRGLVILKQNTKLNTSATQKNQDMIANQYFSHDSPFDNQKNFSYFISQQKYEFVRISENLAMGDFLTASEVVDAWMKSTGHRSNILFPHYTETGISVKNGSMNGKKSIIIVQHFGIPRSVCPNISDAVVQTMQNLEQKAEIAKKGADILRDQLYEAEKQTSDNSLFNKLIDQYNNAIRTYNQFVTEFQSIASEYQRQVKNYDTCVEKLN